MDTIDLVVKFSNLASDELPISDVIRKSQFMILVGFAFLISALLMLFSKRIGWAISIASWMVMGLVVLSLIYYNSLTTNYIDSNLQYWVAGSTIAGCFIFASVLMSKSIREKFNINRNSWIYLGITLLFFLLNKILV